MSSVYFLLSLFYLNCETEGFIFLHEELLQEQGLVKCITEIVEKYFSEENSLTYVDMESGYDDILKGIHSSEATAVFYRQVNKQSYFRHRGYLITSKTTTKFTENFKYLLQEPTWNPYARFLIIIGSLKDDELKTIFDELLKRLVINVIVVNGTKDAEIYTYNPYENYRCGKHYDKVISYGLCSKKQENLFPNKLVTGLKNCTFLATLGEKPPYSIPPWISSTNKPGTEQVIFQILADIEQFKVNFAFEYDKRIYTTIAENMTVKGPMQKLQRRETDVMFGGAVLVSSRADAFTYLHGHLDYDDELRFIVKRANFKAIWKTAYLEFQPFVWCLLLIVFLLYSTIMVILLRAKDKSDIMMKLLNSLLVHGVNIPDRRTGRFIFIIWLWFVYLITSIYQSSLVSITANPILERQILTEEDLVKHNMKPCISPWLLVFINSETNTTGPNNIFGECLDALENVKIIARSEDMFTLVQHSFFKYYKKTFNDEFGRSPVYSMKKPYVKIISGYFFRKGFPVSTRMRKNAIRLRETGLVDKSLKDHYYAREIKFHFHDKGFVTRFVMPWGMYAIGCVVSSVVFIFELLWARYKK